MKHAAFLVVAIAQILAKPAAYDHKVVQVAGRVVKFEQRTSRAGRQYFDFKLTDGKGSLQVFGQGAAPAIAKEGKMVIVTGTYEQEHHVGTLVFKNEVVTKPADVIMKG